MITRFHSSSGSRNTYVWVIFLVGLSSACNFNGGASSVAPGWLGVGKTATPTLSLDDDSENYLTWKSSSSFTGSMRSPTISGDCKDGISEVKVKVNSTLKVTTPCISERFSASLTGSVAFTANGVYTVEFIGISSGGASDVTVSRSYDVRYFDPSTLISFDSFPATSIYGSETLSGTCNYALTLTIAGASMTCSLGAGFSERPTLSLGSNSLLVNWTDDYHNLGTRTFAITRNPAGGTELTQGMISAVTHGSLTLQNVTSGAVSQSPTLERTSSTGTKNGVVDRDVPLSITPLSGATGLTLSVGNHSYVFCKTQNSLGVCIP